MRLQLVALSLASCGQGSVQAGTVPVNHYLQVPTGRPRIPLHCNGTVTALVVHHHWHLSSRRLVSRLQLQLQSPISPTNPPRLLQPPTLSTYTLLVISSIPSRQLYTSSCSPNCILLYLSEQLATAPAATANRSLVLANPIRTFLPTSIPATWPHPPFRLRQSPQRRRSTRLLVAPILPPPALPLLPTSPPIPQLTATRAPTSRSCRSTW